MRPWLWLSWLCLPVFLRITCHFRLIWLKPACLFPSSPLFSMKVQWLPWPHAVPARHTGTLLHQPGHCPLSCLVCSLWWGMWTSLAEIINFTACLSKSSSWAVYTLTSEHLREWVSWRYKTWNRIVCSLPLNVTHYSGGVFLTQDQTLSGAAFDICTSF